MAESPSSKLTVERRVIVMARCPEAGKAKTRLIPALGPDGAARLHASLVRHTLSIVRQFAAESGGEIDVRFAGGNADDMRRLFGSDLRYTVQRGESLGDRMSLAAGEAFSDGCRQIVLIGTDCPQLRVHHLQQAFSSLSESEIAIGPALDGGYYLLGMREHLPELFDNMHWGCESVLQETLQRVKRMSKSKELLPPLSDVDFPEDLVICRQFPESFETDFPQPQKGMLSIIIPAFNEEAGLAMLLESLSDKSQTEVIVVDGGSSDTTCQIAERAGVKVIRCRSGRGRQMNAGAAMARGEVLLFLHADSKLPSDFAQTILKSVESGYRAGAFRLRIDDPHWAFRLVEFGANLRSRWLRLPYGDQALFVRSEDFFAMGGFRNWPLMEDFEFVQRLRSRGRLMIASSSSTVSARRWQRIGVFKATLINQIILIAYRLGVSPARLATLYRRAK
ncbi:MAG: TIGR04283 family arsenosugar biosynthesis glycosyltransferase [Planctomycetaceae bacterium]|nr:TIGR04283 family arsenosugar biosynthesis glycosyltransferase [Planctomycetaceae bacterium]